MPEESAKRGIKRRRAAEDKADHGHGKGAFENVAGERRCGQEFAPGTEHIGGADIARTDAAQIGRAGKAGQKHAKRNRAAQIAEDQRRGILEHR
jgi:hypothetical protein